MNATINAPEILGELLREAGIETVELQPTVMFPKSNTVYIFTSYENFNRITQLMKTKAVFVADEKSEE